MRRSDDGQGCPTRAVGQQREGELLTHAGNGARRSSFSRHTGLCRSICRRPWSDPQLQPGDVGRNAGTDGAGGGNCGLLRDQHRHHLLPPGSEGVELLGFGVAQRTHGGLDRLSKVGQHGGVQGVGLGQPPSSPGKSAHLARVDDDSPAVRSGIARASHQCPCAGSWPGASRASHHRTVLGTDMARGTGADSGMVCAALATGGHLPGSASASGRGPNASGGSRHRPQRQS